MERQDTHRPVGLAACVPPRNWLLFAAAGPIVALALLRAGDVPLGKPGTFVYPYSPVAGLRAGPALVGVILSAAVAASIVLVGSAAPWRRRAGWVLATVGWTVISAWTYFAPPGHYNQHVFNATSPSHDGAFVREALSIEDVPEYLRGFPDRTRTPIARMRGTRVVSNPPGTTLLAVAANSALAHLPVLGNAAAAPFDRSIQAPEVDRAALRPAIRLGIAFFWLLTALWALSAPLYYALGRLHFDAPIALAFALGVVFCGPLLLFSPGKDAAQLLTVVVPLLLWLLATRPGASAEDARRTPGARWAVALAAGATFILATLVSLVHAWVALVVLTASGVTALRMSKLRSLLIAALLPASVGAAAAILLCGTVGLDYFATCAAVAEAQARVTRGTAAMPTVWQALGIPLFILFAGPALWVMLGWSCRSGGAATHVEGRALFGDVLLSGSAAVMVATVGFTNAETPRLWIPFIPLLLLGAMLRIDALRPGTRAVSRPALSFVALLVFAQLVTGWLQWSQMDMRESETRITEGRYFG
ncbi:MAG: hypothetical protein IPM13_06545 [Phycisphaerales bacterium]|nr:hypothetical protein [Phycisphaerales bacterium]